MSTIATEHEDFLEFEDETHEHEDFLEFEDETHEHEDFLEFDHENFLGDLVNSVLGGELTGPLAEHEEMEFAHELLEVTSEQELEQFLGRLISRAAKGVSKFARSSAGKALGGVLKSVAKKALPVVGGALGSMVAPGIGTAIGSKLGSLAGRLFELEHEVGEHELELEMARRVVRIGATAARQAAAQAARGVPPKVAARRSVLVATRMHAPAALSRSGAAGPRPGAPLPGFRTRRPAATAHRRPRRPRQHGYGYPGGYDNPVGNGYPVETAYDPDGFPADSAERGQWVRRGGNIVLIGA